MLKLYVSILCVMIVAFCVYISDKPIIRGGTMVGKFRANGTAVTKEKRKLRKLTNSNSLYVVKLPAETAEYLKNLPSVKNNYESNKKFIMYTSALDDDINCPYGRVFQDAFVKARNNEENERYYSFHTLPAILPSIKQKDIDKMKKANINFTEDYMPEEEAVKLMDLHNTCALFCIINPVTNNVISFFGVGRKEADSLQILLDYVKDKNF